MEGVTGINSIYLAEVCICNMSEKTELLIREKANTCTRSMYTYVDV